MAETTVSFDEGEAPAELNFYGSSSQWDAGAAASSSSRGQPASYSYGQQPPNSYAGYTNQYNAPYSMASTMPPPAPMATSGPAGGYSAPFAAAANAYFAPPSQNDVIDNKFGVDEEEEPLLQELGINFQHMKEKTLAVLNVARPVDSHLMDDTDLAGPLVFCLLFSTFLLMSGKLQFGFVYGVAAIGCLGLYFVLGLMSETTLSLAQTASVLGYSLLPMVALSSVAILLNLSGIIGMILASLSVTWCTVSSSRIFSSVLKLHDQRLLVAYPCALLYGVFALLTVF